jgi:hypothetical protein
MESLHQWVLLAYRLPREPSTPRITLWRKLRRLGAGQLLDGLVALPLTSRTREQFEWLADEVLEAGGQAAVWLAQPLSSSQERELVHRMSQAVADEYRAILAQALEAQDTGLSTRRRTLTHLRRELRHVTERDYFRPPEQQEARAAVEALAAMTGVPS